MIRRPPRSTQSRSSAASDVYKRQVPDDPSKPYDIKDVIRLVADEGRFFEIHEHYAQTVSYTHLRAHETVLDLVCRLPLEKKKYH